MGIVNRRNAMIGWATWTVGKNVARIHLAKRKAKAVVPSRNGEGSTKKRKAVKLVAVVAAAGGAVAFWKAKNRGDGAEDVFVAEEVAATEETGAADE